MGPLYRIGSLLLLLFPLLGEAEVLSIRLVGGEAGFSAQVQARVEALIRQSEPDINFVENLPVNSRRLLIAVGTKGWRLAEAAPNDLPVLAVLPPRLSYDLVSTNSGRTMSAVYGDMAPSRFFNFVQLLSQKRGGAVALIAGPHLQPRGSRLEVVAGGRGIRLYVEKI